MIIKIAGQEVPFKYGSIDIDDAIGQRSTASFTIVDKAGNKRYYKGQPVEIYEDDGATLVFGGVIERPVSKYISLAGNGKLHAITCTDWHYLADKRIVAKYYEQMAAGDIVRDLVTNYLKDEGITVGDIQTGPNVTEAVFNYVTVTQALEGLAEKAAFEFNIDKDKKLNFFDRSTNYAATTITETSDIKNVDVEPSAEDYRNRQYVRAGKDVTDPQTESFKGNGSQRSFTVGFDIAKEPTIKVDGVTLSNTDVGIKGLEQNKKWYWSKGDKTITQNENDPVLTSAQTIEITYQGLFDIVALTYDRGEIDRMQAVEGGTGWHEDVLDEPYISSRAAAFETANAKLKRYAKIGSKITFDTKIIGLKPGQMLPINLDSYDINDDYLIESAKATELGTHDGKMVYTVTAVDGAATGGWATFFKKMATRGQAFVLRENIKEDEVLTLLDSFNKTWTSSEQPNIFAEVYPSESLYPGAEAYPMFTEGTEVKYLALFDANGEFFRKPISKQTEPAAGELVSTTYIAPFEANGITITHVGWFGDVNATKEVGTGLLVDKQTYNKTKTSIEAVQIDKNDLKGW